ncbi:N-acetyltransferase GCN5 [Aquimarina agarivorans]|uniref:N-acetyltransferase GCN5 n=1 Tax=Aquimarina agarivorans TaxID=980584 RepID=UPI000248F587|nr:N-acetyltransferase GCN5 [Aquimarina agarivorans]
MASFETGVPSWKVWNQANDDQCRLVVSLNKQVVAYAALLPVSLRPQFSGVAEVSYMCQQHIEVLEQELNC